MENTNDKRRLRTSTLATATEFNVLLNTVIETYENHDDAGHTGAWDALVKYVDDGATSRAEEARREAAGELEGALADRDRWEAAYNAAVSADAQRTVGGDAVAEHARIIVEALQAAYEAVPDSWGSYQETAMRHAQILAAQPVAEAAAQADGELTATHGPLHLTTPKTRSIVERGYNIVGYVLRRADGDEVCLSAESAVRWLPQAHYWRLMHEQDGSLFAAPAAQSTPLPAGGMAVGPTDGLRGTLRTKVVGGAQPTPPDDELPPLPEPRAIRAGNSFSKVYALAYTADMVKEYARAALAMRQPQGDEDGKRFCWLNEDHDDADVRDLARYLAGRLGTSSYFAITRDIDIAMAEHAAKQAGKEPS